MILVIDTETTGMWQWNMPNDAPSQPRMVQLAAILADGTGKSLAKFCCLLQPDGWKIEEGAAKIHGITDEMCSKYGVTLATALGFLDELVAGANLVVAHNIDFDSKIIAREYAILKSPCDITALNPYCTMKASTPICKLPGKADFKWPKLAEAYKHFFGIDPPQLHDALIDASLCLDVYFAIQRLGVEPK